MFSRSLSKILPRLAGVRARGFSAIKFASTHEWITVNNGVGTVGISSIAAAALGDVVYVSLPEVGQEFVVGDSFGSVESVKAASDVYMPVGGTIVEINDNLSSNPETVNSSPEEDGWFIKIQMGTSSDPELFNLLDVEEYKNKN